jgi:hypothetical protein
MSISMRHAALAAAFSLTLCAAPVLAQETPPAPTVAPAAPAAPAEVVAPAEAVAPAAPAEAPAPAAPVDAAAPAVAPAEPAAPADTAAPAAPAESAAPAAPAAGGAVAPGEIGQPPAGYGQIVFFRPSKFVGMAVGFKVREAGKELGLMKNGSYFVIAATPGRHEYEVYSEAKDILPVEVEAGEVYYVSGSLSMGVMVGRPNLTPSDAAAFEAVRAKLKMSKL